MMDRYADVDARGGILEPPGIVEVKYRAPQQVGGSQLAHGTRPCPREKIDTCKKWQFQLNVQGMLLPLRLTNQYEDIWK